MNWSVEQLYIDNDTLWLNSISAKDDNVLKNLPTYRKDEDELLDYGHVNPTKRQFRKFVRQGGFGNKGKYLKVK